MFRYLKEYQKDENNIQNITDIEVRRFWDQIELYTLVVFTVKTVCFLFKVYKNFNKMASAVKHTAWEV